MENIKDMKRAIRRAHTRRLKHNRKYYWGYGFPHRQYYGAWGSDKTLSLSGFNEMDSKQLGKVVKNPAMCSCMGCGNARRWFGRSISECSFIELLKTELNDK